MIAQREITMIIDKDVFLFELFNLILASTLLFLWTSYGNFTVAYYALQITVVTSISRVRYLAKLYEIQYQEAHER